MQFRRQRYVPKDFIARLKQIGLYRAATPAKFGGRPLPPAEFLDRIERISAVDGSTGWVASFGSGLVYLAALPLETQAELYADGPDVAFAGGFFPVQPAAATECGFVINGHWKFASGCMGADISGTVPIYSDHPLQLLLGDALVPKQHAFLCPEKYTTPPARS